MKKAYKYSRGVFNNYNEQKNTFEVVLSDLRHLYLMISNYVKNGFKHKGILCYPFYPGKSSTLFKIARELNLTISNKPANRYYVLHINWDLNTFRRTDSTLTGLHRSHQIWNSDCIDISKKKVEEVFHDCFGYGTVVDPTRFKGKIVEKSDLNAVGHGRIFTGPIAKTHKGMVYQRFIETNLSGKEVTDIRVPIINKETLDFVYLKTRDLTEFTKNSIKKTSMESLANQIDKTERELIHKFVEKINLDFGELDILKDIHTGNLYIIDVNTTPTGPSGLSKKQKQVAIRSLATRLDQAINATKSSHKQSI